MKLVTKEVVEEMERVVWKTSMEDYPSVYRVDRRTNLYTLGYSLMLIFHRSCWNPGGLCYSPTPVSIRKILLEDGE